MLEQIIQSIRKNQNIKNKFEIESIVQTINKESFHSSRIFTDLGEDSASIIFGENLILMTTDRIKTSYIEKYPEGAGFSSILVGVDDIYCCGGKPLAASVIISYKNKQQLQKLIKGIIKGSNKFKVPIIRGHTNPNSDYLELSSTMIGEIPKRDYISARNAQKGDNIIFALDEEGKIARVNELYWDTVTFKSTDSILSKRMSMIKIAKDHLANSAKDVANGGLIGSILQLCRYSGFGASLNIDGIIIPEYLNEKKYDIIKFLKMYLTTSYVLTATEEYADRIISVFNKYNMGAYIIGKIIKEPKLKISIGNETKTVFENLYQQI